MKELIKLELPSQLLKVCKLLSITSVSAIGFFPKKEMHHFMLRNLAPMVIFLPLVALMAVYIYINVMVN
jgi:hypothetical protein